MGLLRKVAVRGELAEPLRIVYRNSLWSIPPLAGQTKPTPETDT